MSNLANFGAVITDYTITDDDALLVQMAIVPEGITCPLPRIGMRVELDSSFDRYTYIAKGPLETYPDRQASGRQGLYQAKVGEDLDVYLKPQECGNREDLRAVLVQTDGSGAGTSPGNLLVTPLQRSSFSLLPYSSQELMQYKHNYELPASTKTYLSLDLKQSGLGNRSCGPETMEQYLVIPKPYTFAFALRSLSHAPSGEELRDYIKRDYNKYLIDMPFRDGEFIGSEERSMDKSENTILYRDPSDPDQRAAIGMHP